MAARIIILPIEIGGIQKSGEIPEQILGGHGGDPAAVLLEERGNDAPVLVKRFVARVFQINISLN
jgi:hypothetical protein